MMPDDCQITVYTWLSIDQDSASARANLEPFVHEWAAMALYPRLTVLARTDADLAISDGPPLAEAIVGTPAECASAVDAIIRAGANAIVFVPATAESLAMLERFHRDVEPLLAS
jgi:alkanesulfonate monooxygenase SsuD/methylene tetrahydromethanopterin reductase-like flavin-dependent oxidoreductase (luciferase family)